MIIVDYNTFIKLPAGTVYSEYEPSVFGELQVKGNSIEDFDYLSMLLRGGFAGDDGTSNNNFDTICDNMEKGIIARADFDYFGRDGMFDQNRQYQVYDKQDIQDLRDFLNTLI